MRGSGMFMNDNTVYEKHDLLERFMVDIFVLNGVPEDDARVCANVLTEADLRGIDSHGFGRFKHLYIDRIKAGMQNPVTQFEIVREGPTTAVVDGHEGMGQVIGKKAMETAIDKASKYGMGMVAVRNSTHYGIAGYYPLMAVEKGMIGITGSNSRPTVAPTFGVESILGTNPIAFGMPTDEEFPFLFDCATSTAQRGKIEFFARTNRNIPEGWVIGENGESRTDVQQINIDLDKGKAALLPLGGMGELGSGHKGYGFATVVEILSAALQGGVFLKALAAVDENGRHKPSRLGHFFIAIDINAFTELESFKKTAGDILRQLRASKKAPGHDRIYTAGEKEYLTRLERMKTGIPLNKKLQDLILNLKAEYGLSNYRFSFE